MDVENVPSNAPCAQAIPTLADVLRIAQKIRADREGSGPQKPVAMEPGPPAVSLARIEAYLAPHRAAEQARSIRRKQATPPKGNGPARAAPARNSLPPPHIPVPPKHQDRQLSYEHARAAREKKGFADTGGLPWWAFVVAERCLKGGHLDEVKRLPRHLSEAVRTALDWQGTEHARRSVAALGCVLGWLSWRQTRRLGHASNVGGVPKALLRALTRTQGGAPYSHSSVAHRSHTTGAVADASAGEAGFLESLAQAGAIRSWIPPACAVPDWMKGHGYAFAIYRASDPVYEPDPEPPDLDLAAFCL